MFHSNRHILEDAKNKTFLPHALSSCLTLRRTLRNYQELTEIYQIEYCAAILLLDIKYFFCKKIQTSVPFSDVVDIDFFFVFWGLFFLLS